MDWEYIGEEFWASGEPSNFSSRQREPPQGCIEDLSRLELWRTTLVASIFQRKDDELPDLEANSRVSNDGGFHEPPGTSHQDHDPRSQQVALSPRCIRPWYGMPDDLGRSEPPSPLLQDSDLVLRTREPPLVRSDSSGEGGVSGSRWAELPNGGKNLRCGYQGCDMTYSRAWDLGRHRRRHHRSGYSDRSEQGDELFLQQDLYSPHRERQNPDVSRSSKTEMPITATTSPRSPLAVVRTDSRPQKSTNVPHTSESGFPGSLVPDSGTEGHALDLQEGADQESEWFRILSVLYGKFVKLEHQKGDPASSLVAPGALDAGCDTTTLARTVKADETEVGSESESDNVFADSPDPTSRSEGEMSFMDSDERGSSPVPWTPAIVRALVIVRMVLASLLVKTYFATPLIASGGVNTSDTPDAPAASTAAKTTASAAKTTARQTAQKRKFRSDEEGEHGQGDDENDGDRPGNESKSKSDSLSKPLACPFFKNDPTRYSERNNMERQYRICSTVLLKDISRLKQHLYRVHRRPDDYCGRCYQVFQSETLLEEHVWRDPPCQLSGPLFQEKMTAGQIAQIKRRRPGKSVGDNWYGIFKILFPDCIPPNSPYAESICTEGVQRFLSFAESQGSTLFQQLLINELQQEPLVSSLIGHIVADAVERAVPLFMRQLVQQFSTVDQSLNSPIQDQATLVQFDANNNTATVAPEVWGNQADAPSALPPSFGEAVQILRESELNSEDMTRFLDAEDQYLFNMDAPMIENPWHYPMRAPELSTESA